MSNTETISPVRPLDHETHRFETLLKHAANKRGVEGVLRTAAAMIAAVARLYVVAGGAEVGEALMVKMVQGAFADLKQREQVAQMTTQGEPN